MSNLKQKLLQLRPAIAQAAQEIIDAWVQDEDGFDEELGSGGVCDRVSEAISYVVSEIHGVEIIDGGQDGDDHAFLIVYDANEAFAVDIPPQVYETGGGYSWKKITGAIVQPEDVIIEKVKRSYLGLESESKYLATLKKVASRFEKTLKKF